MAARVFSTRPADEEFSEAPSGQSALEKIYALKNHVPERIKHPTKLVLAKLLTKAIERRDGKR